MGRIKNQQSVTIVGGEDMIPKISQITILNDFILKVTFDDNKTVIYNVKDDFDSIPAYKNMVFDRNIFHQF